MSIRIEISDANAFDDSFGLVGLKVGPRKGPNKRTKEDEEWYVVRRFLKCALSNRYFVCPVGVEKADPPDFILQPGAVVASVEITQATSNADQVEMTKIGESDGEAA